MRNSLASVLVVGSLAIAGCASTSGSGREEAAFSSYNDCFFARSVTDWRPLDNRNLVVFAGARRAYHVELSMRSMSLRYQDQIAFTDRDGRICPYGGDSIVVNGALPDRISISSIRRLTESQLTDLYLAYGIRVPEIIETPEPADAQE